MRQQSLSRCSQMIPCRLFLQTSECRAADIESLACSFQLGLVECSDGGCKENTSGCKCPSEGKDIVVDSSLQEASGKVQVARKDCIAGRTDYTDLKTLRNTARSSAVDLAATPRTQFAAPVDSSRIELRTFSTVTHTNE